MPRWSWAPILLSGAGLACLWPVLARATQGIARAIAEGAPLSERGIQRLGLSVLVASGIALAATVIGWIAAGSGLLRRDRWLGFLLVPLCMPSYLAYAGWGLLLAPMTTLGDAVARLGGSWPLLAGKSLAVVGLVLWAWPIAALVLVLARRRVPSSTLDALCLEPMSGVRRQLELARIMRPALVLGFSAIALVMLGSAVPLHLAQFDTYTIEVWRELDSGGPAGAGAAWARAWPILLVAIAVPCLPRRVWSWGQTERTSPPDRDGAGIARVAVPLLLSVGVPGLLLARTGWAHVGRFWGVMGEAAGSSAMIALAVAGAGIALGVLAWRTLDLGPRWVVSGLARLFFASAIVPGILVGSAVGSGWRLAPAISDTRAAVILAHIARFGFVAILAGAWAHASMPRDLNALRAVDGATTFRGWVRSAWPLARGAVVAGGCVLACLSMHEIEASVQVQPPGVRSLAREILQRLHYLREEDVAAAAVWIITAGLLLACGAAITGRGSLRRVNEGGPTS